MKEKVNHPAHYNAGTPEVIKIIDAWGLAGDFYASNVLKYFLRAPHKESTTQEEDYRKAMWHLEKIYERSGETKIKHFNNQTNKTVVIPVPKLNLKWFKPVTCFRGTENCEVTLREVIKGWNLEGDRMFFMENFYYQTFNCELCIKLLSDLIDSVSGT